MKADHKKAIGNLKTFAVMTNIYFLGCLLVLVVGPPMENTAFHMLFVFACASWHISYVLEIFKLQKRLSELEAGSTNDSKGESSNRP